MNVGRWIAIGTLLVGAAAPSLTPTAALAQAQSPPGRRMPQDVGDDVRTASMHELLKRYEALWVNHDATTLRPAEQALLAKLEQAPAFEVVALFERGLSTRAGNLVSIAVENAMGGPRRDDYENALVAAMERVFEQPDKLATVSGHLLRLNPSPQNAEAAAQLLMKRAPEGESAAHLGAFASLLEGVPRSEVKQFAVEHGLIEAQGYLVDDWTDVARLQDYLRDPATRDRAAGALRTALRSAESADLRRELARSR